MAEIPIIIVITFQNYLERAHTSLIGMASKMFHLPGYFVVRNGRCIQHVFGGGHVLLQIATYPEQPYKLFKSGQEHGI
jgi:hypothetical protein